MNELLDIFLMDKSTYCEPVTLNYYKEDVGYFIKFCMERGIKDIDSINRNVLSSYILHLRQTGISNVSIHTYYRAVKSFVRWMYDEKYIDTDYTLKIKLPKKDPKLVLPLTAQEVQQIDNFFLKFDSFLGLRNYCIFHLMLDCGLRRSEVINLNYKDIKGNNLYIRISKNNKSRIVLIPQFLKQSIVNYYNSVSNHADACFYNRYNTSRITQDTIRKLFADLKKLSGVERIHPHLCRHTFATSYALNVGNLEMLRLLLGHADYNITQNYLHLANQQKLVNADVYKIDEIFKMK